MKHYTKQEAEQAILEHLLEIRKILHAYDPGEDYLAMTIIRHEDYDSISFNGTTGRTGRLDCYKEFPPVPGMEDQ